MSPCLVLLCSRNSWAGPIDDVNILHFPFASLVITVSLDDFIRDTEISLFFWGPIAVWM